MSFLSDADYAAFLAQRIGALDDATAREYVMRRFEFWRQQYCGRRAVERAAELLTSEKDRPNMLYLRSQVDIGLLRLMAQRYRFDARVFRGFLVDDSLWG